ncbi:glycosyltransferase [Micromonospora sp. SL4-19]|uniref:glycosyltransferase n=1 Tax=Micromonospora sp. SL4-19 TaxID=3399129 RepID=UPI003A4DF896
MSARIPWPRDGHAPAPYVLAVVGTDVHRFDRLVDWLERWHAGRPRVRVVLQYGHSRTPRLPEAAPFLGHEELQRAMAEATLVVSHGGPATITEARRNGHLPIVVPRDPAHDEHVDNHQQLFSRRLGVAGMVRLCESETDLVTALDAGLADPSRFALAADPNRPDPRAEAVARVGQVIDDLVARRVRQRAGGRR